jgi:hypothetical protein
VQKSAQSIENKRVAFLLNAKMCKGVPRKVGRKGRRVYTPPIKMDHFQNKGVAGIAFCK